MDELSPDIAKLITAGLDGARIVVGADGAPASAAEMADSGARLFGAGRPEPAVAAFLTNDRASIELVLGAIAAGGRLISLPLPSRSADLIAFGNFIKKTCIAHNVSSVVARDDIAALLDSIGLAVRPHSTLGTEAIAVPAPGGFELVQFSSGTTGRPAGIALSSEVLGVNVTAILEAVDPRPGDVTVSWLPLSHDMGLIGMLLTSVAACSPARVGSGNIVITEPESFLRSPGSWIVAIDKWGGSFTAAPDFGYRLAAQRRPAGAFDLSRLRCAIIGGEIIRADTLQATTDAFAADHLDPVSLCPAYGLAELGLAASMTSPQALWREEELDIAALSERRRLRPADNSAAKIRLVSSGQALDGYRIEVGADPSEIGPIRIASPAIGRDSVTGKTLDDSTGALPTGDLGFVSDDGWLYVCGRSDDHIVAHGRNIYAPALENAISLVPGLRPGRVAAVDMPTGDWIIVAECADANLLTQPKRNDLRREARRVAVSVSSASPTEIVFVKRGALPMTNSGKLQRHEVRRRYLNDTLDVG